MAHKFKASWYSRQNLAAMASLGDPIAADAVARLGAEESGKRWRVVVVADSTGNYFGNGRKFGSVSDAEDYARGLASRWTLVVSWAVIPAGLTPDRNAGFSPELVKRSSAVLVVL